jgi:hypothetical protein
LSTCSVRGIGQPHLHCHPRGSCPHGSAAQRWPIAVSVLGHGPRTMTDGATAPPTPCTLRSSAMCRRRLNGAENADVSPPSHQPLSQAVARFEELVPAVDIDAFRQSRSWDETIDLANINAPMGLMGFWKLDYAAILAGSGTTSSKRSLSSSPGCSPCCRTATSEPRSPDQQPFSSPDEGGHQSPAQRS